MLSGAVEANRKPAAASSTANPASAASILRGEPSGLRTQPGFNLSIACRTASVMAPSIKPLIANSPGYEHRGPGHRHSGDQQFRHREKCADHDRKKRSREDARFSPPATTKELIRQPCSQDSRDRHIENVRSERQNTAILQNERLPSED